MEPTNNEIGFEQKTPSKPSTFFIIFIILIIIAGSLSWLALYLWPTAPASEVTSAENQFEGWKTYRNDRYSEFEIKIPQNWHIQTLDSGTIVIQSSDFNNNLDKYYVPDIGNIWISIDQNVSNVEGSDSTFISSSEVPGAVKKNICSSSLCVNFGLWQSDSKKSEHENLINKIISTIKFTNATTTVDTSNWKTYTNAEYGFEFKYPRNWVMSTTTVVDSHYYFYSENYKGDYENWDENYAYPMLSFYDTKPTDRTIEEFAIEFAYGGLVKLSDGLHKIKVINGINFVETGGYESDRVANFISTPQTNFVVIFSVKNDSPESFVFNQLFQTFKFTK